MTKRGLRVLALVAALVALFLVHPVAASDPSPAELLPPTSVAFLQLNSVSQIVDTLLDHPLRPKLEAMDQVQASYEKKPFLDLKAAVAVVESQMGMPWRKMVAQAIGGTAVIAIDAKTEGIALFLESKDDAVQKQLVKTLVHLATVDATTKGNPDPVKTVSYRGLTAYSIGPARIALLGRRLVVTNKDGLAKWIADSHLDHPAVNLATDEVFLQARQEAPSQAAAWGWMNTGALRAAGVAKKLYNGKAGNGLAELLFGGILSTLQQTPFLTASLMAEKQQVTLTFAAPHERSWAGDTREYFFGPDGKGAAPSTLAVKNKMLALGAYRDVSAMWLRAGDLLDDKANEGLAKAESNLSTLFGGKDFAEDILGSFAPELQVIVARQEFTDGKPQPAIKLPAFSFVFQLKDPQKMQPELRRTFQSLIGFLNVVGAMNGQPQLELDMEKSDNLQLVTATYLLDAKEKDPTSLRINHNFSPSLAFTGSTIVIASTKELARELAVAAKDGIAAPKRPEGITRNTDVTVQLDVVQAALADNRGQLIAQNMLREGHTKQEAERAVDTLLELVGWFNAASVRLDTTDRDLKFSVSASIDTVAP